MGMSEPEVKPSKKSLVLLSPITADNKRYLESSKNHKWGFTLSATSENVF